MEGSLERLTSWPNCGEGQVSCTGVDRPLIAVLAGYPSSASSGSGDAEPFAGLDDCVVRRLRLTLLAEGIDLDVKG